MAKSKEKDKNSKRKKNIKYHKSKDAQPNHNNANEAEKSTSNIISEVQIEKNTEMTDITCEVDDELDISATNGSSVDTSFNSLVEEDCNSNSPKKISKINSTKTSISKKTSKKSTTVSLNKISPALDTSIHSNSSSTNPTPTQSTTINTANSTNKRKRRRDSETSSDEERWLTAIESGKLEDVDDELKKIKDPKLMTARQRAMYERSNDKEPFQGTEVLMSLPTGYREREKPQTAEDIQKAVLKSQKRKEQADAKREKDKKKTMERLLKKQESKQRSTVRNKPNKILQPMLSYKITPTGTFINIPNDFEFPLQAQMPRDPPKVQLCGITGCGKPKIYNCSKTNIPLCSLECYRKNVQSIRHIIC